MLYAIPSTQKLVPTIPQAQRHSAVPARPYPLPGPSLEPPRPGHGKHFLSWIVVIVGQQYKVTKIHQTGYLQWMDCMLCKLYLNKAVRSWKEERIGNNSGSQSIVLGTKNVYFFNEWKRSCCITHISSILSMLFFTFLMHTPLTTDLTCASELENGCQGLDGKILETIIEGCFLKKCCITIFWMAHKTTWWGKAHHWWLNQTLNVRKPWWKIIRDFGFFKKVELR